MSDAVFALDGQRISSVFEIASTFDMRTGAFRVAEQHGQRATMPNAEANPLSPCGDTTVIHDEIVGV